MDIILNIRVFTRDYICARWTAYQDRTVRIDEKDSLESFLFSSFKLIAIVIIYQN